MLEDASRHGGFSFWGAASHTRANLLVGSLDASIHVEVIIAHTPLSCQP